MSLRPLILCIGSTAIGFFAGAATSSVRGWGSPVVSVNVVNRSGLPVGFVTVEYESCGSKSALAGRPPAVGEATTFRFLVCGEGGYQVVAHLDSGVELKGRGSYVESGYRATEILQAQSIESSVDSHLY